MVFSHTEVQVVVQHHLTRVIWLILDHAEPSGGVLLKASPEENHRSQRNCSSSLVELGLVKSKNKIMKIHVDLFQVKIKGEALSKSRVQTASQNPF